MIETDYDSYAANQLEAWMAVEDIDHDELEDQFKQTDEYQDALDVYNYDFPYSAEYELAYERWLHERIENET